MGALPYTNHYLFLSGQYTLPSFPDLPELSSEKSTEERAPDLVPEELGLEMVEVEQALVELVSAQVVEVELG